MQLGAADDGNEERELNDVLPVSVNYRPRPPSSQRMRFEMQQFEENKRMQERESQKKELKKFLEASKNMLSEGGDGGNNIENYFKEVKENKEILAIALDKGQSERIAAAKIERETSLAALALGGSKVKISVGNSKMGVLSKTNSKDKSKGKAGSGEREKKEEKERKKENKDKADADADMGTSIGRGTGERIKSPSVEIRSAVDKSKKKRREENQDQEQDMRNEDNLSDMLTESAYRAALGQPPSSPAR